MNDLRVKPHKYQRLFLFNKSRYRAFISGIGGGKTFIGCFMAILTMLKYPNITGAIIAPTYRMLSDVTIKTFLEICPPEYIIEHKRGENIIRFFNGSEVLFRSADEPDKLRGPNLGWFYIDEAALVSHKTWKIMVGRLRVSPERGWITSTPKGFNWIYSEFAKEVRDGYWFTTFATNENPYLSQEYISSLKGSYSGAFLDQEFGGKFTAMEGLVYRDFSRGKHVFSGDLPVFKEFIGGCDFGFTNPSVCLVIGVDADDRFWLVDELYHKGLSHEEYVKAVRGFHDIYKFTQVYCDPAAPEYIQALNNVGVPAVGVKRGVMEGITLFTQRLLDAGDGLPRFMVHERCVNSIMEFENYCYPEFKEDKPVQENPIKIHDHAMDALSYANFGYNKRVDFRIEYLDF